MHTHSNFSFLDGASHPEDLVEQAAKLELDAIALTDHDGMYGVARFAEAGRELGVRTAYGTELSLGLSQPQNGIADPEGQHLLLLARDAEGYSKLCKAISIGQLDEREGVVDPALARSEKGRPIYDIERVAAEVRGYCAVLTGCRKGAVRRALFTEGPLAAQRELRRLVDLFGRGQVYVELIDHGMQLDSLHNDLLAGLAEDLDLPVVVSNAVHYARPERGRLAEVLAAVRARRSLDDMAGWLPPAPTAYLRSGREQRDWFGRYPDALTAAAILGVECSFDLRLLAPDCPRSRCPRPSLPRRSTCGTWLLPVPPRNTVPRRRTRRRTRRSGTSSTSSRSSASPATS